MKKINQYEKQMDNLLKESIEKTSLTESKHNKMILDTIDNIHKTIMTLKDDDTINKTDLNKLFVTFKPLFNALHKLVN